MLPPVLFQKYNSPISLSQADYNEIYEKIFQDIQSNLQRIYIKKKEYF